MCKKNMSNDYQFINSIPINIFSVKGMIINDGFMNLNILLQKSTPLQHHYKNYEESKKCPAFEPISKDYNIKWNNILRDAERSLVELTK